MTKKLAFYQSCADRTAIDRNKRALAAFGIKTVYRSGKAFFTRPSLACDKHWQITQHTKADRRAKDLHHRAAFAHQSKATHDRFDILLFGAALYFGLDNPLDRLTQFVSEL